MQFLLLTAVFLPTVAFAQSACYSPSDCAAPLICSSLIDNIFPGTCIAGGEDPLYELQDVIPLGSSSSSVSSSVSTSSSTSSAQIPQPTLAEVRVLSSSSSSVSSDASSSSAEVENAEEESTGNVFTKAWNGVKSFFCYFFCSEE